MGPDAGPPATSARSALDVARTVAESAMSHDDVVELDTGLAGEFATYGFGGRVAGVRVDLDRDDRAHVRVRIVVRFGRPIPDIGDEVRSQIVSGLHAVDVDGSVDVHVADIVEVAEPTDSPALPSGTT